MTEKELLYVEDALGHEKYLRTQLCETANSLQDSELKEFAQRIRSKHESVFQSFYHLL